MLGSSWLGDFFCLFSWLILGFLYLNFPTSSTAHRRGRIALRQEPGIRRTWSPLSSRGSIEVRGRGFGPSRCSQWAGVDAAPVATGAAAYNHAEAAPPLPLGRCCRRHTHRLVRRPRFASSTGMQPTQAAEAHRPRHTWRSSCSDRSVYGVWADTPSGKPST